MKSYILAFVLVMGFYCEPSMAQLSAKKTQTATEQETIDWFVMKLKLYAQDRVDRITDVTVDQCNLQIKLRQPYGTNNGGYPAVKTLYTFPVHSLVISQTGNSSDGGLLSMENNLNLVRLTLLSGKDEGNEYLRSSYEFTMNWNNEENLLQRMQNALNHLKTFCPKPSKPKETF